MKIFRAVLNTSELFVRGNREPLLNQPRPPPHNAQKMKFSIKGFFRKYDQIRSADLVTFTEEILN